MKKIAIAIVVIVILSASAPGCAFEDRDVPSSSISVTPRLTASVHDTGSGAESAHFVWQPDWGREYGSDAGNMSAGGIVDGDGGTLYFQAPNGGEGPLYSLYELNEATGETRELATECYGMISVLEGSVFYIGEVSQGAYRYDTRTGSVGRLYEGIVLNLLAAKDYLYVINGAGELVQVAVSTGEQVRVSDGVAWHYLQYADGCVYFAQLAPDELNCNVRKVTAGVPTRIANVYEGVPYPVKMVGNQVLYGDEKGLHLIDIDTKEASTVHGREVRAGMPAANGNGVFYITTDDQGYRELCVFDVESGETSMLAPVHGGTIYFVDGEIFLVNPVNFDIERVILDPNDPRTELVLRGDSQAE